MKASCRVNTIIKERGLKLNQTKSRCIVIGSRKQKIEASDVMMSGPLKCGEVIIKEEQEIKWLGQYISSRGLGHSVLITIEAREGKNKGACLEIASIIQDWRSQAAGGMDTALLLWESCCIPSLLHGAGTWDEISSTAEARLEALEHWFLRLILRIGPGCPLPSLRWESGVLAMSLRIWILKVMLVRHLRSMEKSTLARQIYEEQKTNNWPGLARETKVICQELGIEDCNETSNSMNNKDYRNMLIQSCRKKDEERLKDQAAGKEKCDKIMIEDYGKKEYMSEQSIEGVRQYFYSRVRMQPFRGDYSKDKHFMKSNWLCKCGNEHKEESHIMSGSCEVYGDIRNNYGQL